ncbi:cell division protein FtsX [Geosporobacter ferrireducens]|uniref:Cell division protein FtsX n=1 Tax=Geosporobacter ferrireducens TaxID=1424294 RepID=A0A1D8GMD1_9FIRM|nr:permease-like cell division protein FtsX [Geosporobacter ferrireducens]AOT72096.1 hypothetical protein Gferi_22680 [Geosporobacter ferrireducens]MTI55982.1 hypothetical protein [Geosporobacter ferrireducens]
MTSISSNIGYFFREAKTVIRLNLLTNILSLLSTGLIFFILAMVISGWWVSSEVIEVIQEEAEVSVYFDESLNPMDVLHLVKAIKGIEGVREARIVDQGEAYSRMVEILGEEARVLEFFDDNPFSSFIEVKIHLEQMNPVLEKILPMKGIEHVRDNREILDRLHSVVRILKLVGYLAAMAVGISTLVIISHMIRLGIYHNREQINTLRLLGAPEIFIACPFMLVGMTLTLGGGLLASMMSDFALKEVYAQMTGPLPFIPLPPLETIVGKLALLVITLSISLGFIGSLVGLSSERSN